MRRRVGARPRCALLFAALASMRAIGSGNVRAAGPDAAPVAPSGEPKPDDADAAVESEGFVLPPGVETAPALSLQGYVDFGFADAQGDGTSFPPGDNRVPADYGVDTFAPAVNSRGDAASIDAGGRATNGFLPRSVNIAGRPSFLINTINQDLRYQVPHLMAFVRVQILPRWGGDGAGNVTTLYVEQAFGRVTPLEGRELFIAGGKFDSVFGIEYFDNAAVYRTGITPSLFARYITGTALGLKVFYRQ